MSLMPVPDEWLAPEQVQRRGVGGWMGPQDLGPPSPLIEDAPAPELIGSQRPGGSFLDILAQSIADAGAPQGRLGGGQQVVAGLARGFAQARGGQMDRRQQVQDALAKRQAETNAKAVAANDAARLKRDKTIEQEAGYIPTTGTFAREVGDPSLVGKRLSPAKRAQLLEEAKIRKEGGVKPASTVSARTAANIEALNQREAQMNARLDLLWEKRASAPPEQVALIEQDMQRIGADLDALKQRRAGLMNAADAPVRERAGSGGEVTGSLGYTNEQRDAVYKLSQQAERSKELVQYAKVRDAYTSGLDGAKRKNSLGDIVLMRMIAKGTDPDTGVREEEFRTFEGAQGALAKVGVTLTRSMWGKGQLNDYGRAQMVGVLSDLHSRKKTQAMRAADIIRKQATNVYGIDPELVLREYLPEEESGQPRDLDPSGIPLVGGK